MNLHDQEKSIARVLRAIEAIKVEGMIIMVDEEDRENEGDIVFAAQHVTPEKINFMCREARGLICLALEPKIIDRLELPMMRDIGKSSATRETAFTVSIEAKIGVTTGISAKDRAHTIKVAIDEHSSPDDLVVPGHIFPLRAKDGGILERAGHTEGSIDLIKLSGLQGGAVICEIMNEDGSMARMPDLVAMAKKFNLPIVSIPDLISYRLMQDSLVELVQRDEVQTPGGPVEACLLRSKIDSSYHVAFVKGSDFADKTVDVRVHLQRPIFDVFAGHGEQLSPRLASGLKLLRDSDAAVFVYLTHHDPELVKDEFALLVSQDKTGATFEKKGRDMDQRHIGLGAQILRLLGVKKMRIHTSASKSYIGLSGFGLEVIENQKLN